MMLFPPFRFLYLRPLRLRTVTFHSFACNDHRVQQTPSLLANQELVAIATDTCIPLAVNLYVLN